MDFIIQNWRNIAIPLAVCIFSTMALLQLKNRAFNSLLRRNKDANWPIDIVLLEPIKRPSFILCVILGAYLGLFTFVISDQWKIVAEHTLWTLFVFALVLAILNILYGLILFLEKHLNLPKKMSVVGVITRVAIITVAVLVVLGVWGVPIGPLLLLIAIASILILLSVRDAAPNFFAGLQITTWQHIKVNDLVRLENGKEGHITKIGWTSTHLQTTEGNGILIPNRQLTKQSVTKVESHLKKEVELKSTSILTEREREIAKLISQGTTNKEIANILFITENTAKVHVKNILKKLELKNRQQLAVHAVLKEGFEPYIE